MSFLIRDLVDFQEVEEVIKLHDEREDIVPTYVISDSLRESLGYMLDLLAGATHKSFNVIGNYGTGKSHFLSFVAALLEHPGSRAEISDPAVRSKAIELERPYIVVKFELGATQVPLRHVFFDQVQQQLLDKYDIQIEPVDLQRDYDNVAKMEEIVAAVKGKNPEAGLIVIIDELSDSLRQKPPETMVYDLNFLRELGQISQSMDFVLVSAMQEHVFTNPRYVQEAANIARVAQRFVDITITKEDVQRVLSERVLGKSNDQRLQLQGLLGDHKTYFTNLAEKLDNYVDIFPIHPYVIEVFEQLPYFENRGIIGFAVDNVKPILNEPAPKFITYDRVFDLIDATHEIRNQPTVRPVINVVHSLAPKIDVLPERYRADAQRLIKALAVLKLLEHGAVNGATAQELANTLFIIPPGKLMVDPDMARDNVERILKNVREVTKGQFISYDGDFYFLDLEKVTDYDAEIDARIASWGEGTSQIARAFNNLVADELSVSTQKPLIAGKQVYADSAPWPDHNSFREGILVIGDPQDGDQLQHGDYRLVLVGPVASPTAQIRQDELRLQVSFDDQIVSSLRRMAAAAELAAENAKERKKAFSDVAKEAQSRCADLYLKKLLAEGIATMGGSSTPVNELHTTRPVNILAAAIDFIKGELLSDVFKNKYPNYPSFRTRVTAANLESEMSRAIASLEKATLFGMDLNSRGYLEALGATNKEGQFSSRKSAAAQIVLSSVTENDKKNKVTPLEDILRALQSAPWGLQKPLTLFLVAALHSNGELILVRAGGKGIHAGAPESNLKAGLEFFDDIRYLERDRDINVEQVGRLFEVLGLQKGLVVDKDQRNEAVKKLREKGLEIYSQLQDVTGDFNRARQQEKPLTEIPWLSLESMHANLTGLRTQVDSWRNASKVTDLGKLPQDDTDLDVAASGLTVLEQLRAFLADYHAYVFEGIRYMQQATTHFEQLQEHAEPGESQTLKDLARIYSDSRDILIDQKALLVDDRRRPLKGKIEQFQSQYQPLYYKLHERVVGDQAVWEQLDGLRQSDRYQSLGKLKTLPFFSNAEFDQIGLEIQRLQQQRCINFNADVLDQYAVCPYCRFPETAGLKDISVEANTLGVAIEALWKKWEDQTLSEAKRLISEELGGQPRAELMGVEEKELLESFLRKGELPGKVSDQLISSLHDLSAELDAVTLDLSVLGKRMLAERSVLTVDEMEQVWRSYIAELLKNRQRDQVRIQIQFGEEA